MFTLIGLVLYWQCYKHLWENYTCRLLVVMTYVSLITSLSIIFVFWLNENHFLFFQICEKSLSYFWSTYVTKSTLIVQLWTISPNCEQYLQTVVLMSGAIWTCILLKTSLDSASRCKYSRWLIKYYLGDVWIAVLINLMLCWFSYNLCVLIISFEFNIYS